MAKQWGANRLYTSVKEATNVNKRQCPRCNVIAVPRGIADSRKTASGEKHCPNCGHVYGRANH